MKKVFKGIFRVVFSLLLVFSIFGAFNVFAADVIFQITGISVKEKSDKVTVNNVSLSGGSINNDIVFTDQGDYITYDITIKNVSDDDYTIKSITDDNDSEYLEYTYDNLANVKVNKGESKTFNLTITYKQETSNLTITDKAVSLTLTYEKEDGTTGTETITNNDNNGTTTNNTNSTKITNPKTGDNITIYIILGLISIAGLVITSVSKKHLSKSLMVIALVSSIVIPLGVKADSDKFIIKFNNTISRGVLSAGLYDANDNLIISYDDFVSATGWNITQKTDYAYMYDANSDTEICLNTNSFNEADDITLCSSSISYIIIKNSEYNGTKKIILPDNIITIGDFAFYGSTFERIQIPNSVTTIGESAFEETKNLTEVSIPKSVTSLGQYVFTNSSVEKVIFEEDSQLTDIPDFAFYECANLESVTLPKNLVTISMSAFDGTALVSVTLPNKLTSIGHASFANCQNLKTVIFEENSIITLIGDGAFYNSTILDDIVLPASITTIDEGAFQSTGITTLTIPANVTRIGSDSFTSTYTPNLTTVIFENPNGWSWNGQPMSSEDLSNPETAASMLKNHSISYDWIRTD